MAASIPAFSAAAASPAAPPAADAKTPDASGYTPWPSDQISMVKRVLAAIHAKPRDRYNLTGIIHIAMRTHMDTHPVPTFALPTCGMPETITSNPKFTAYIDVMQCSVSWVVSRVCVAILMKHLEPLDMTYAGIRHTEASLTKYLSNTVFIPQDSDLETRFARTASIDIMEKIEMPGKRSPEQSRYDQEFLAAFKDNPSLIPYQPCCCGCGPCLCLKDSTCTIS